MPQMSPCSWISLMLLMNLILSLIKMNIYFEKKF